MTEVAYEFPEYGLYLLVAWSVLTIVISLVGNVTVLVASMKYKAIKINKVSVIIIQSISISNMANVLFVAFPTTWAICTEPAIVKHFFEKQLFGKIVCLLVSHLQYWLVSGSTVMICALNVCKLECMLSPLRANIRSANTGYYIVIFSYAPYLVRFVETLSITGDKTEYIGWRHAFTCSVVSSKLTTWFNLFIQFLTTFIPGVLLVVTTLWILYLAQNMERL